MHEPFYLSKSWLRFYTVIPCFILHFTILFIYGITMLFYVVPLLNDSYWFDNNPNIQLTDDQFPVFKTIRTLETALFDRFLAGREITMTNPQGSHFKRGLFIVIPLHYFLFWLLFSLFKTMKTNPGHPPSSDSHWVVKIENKVTAFHEREKAVVKKFVKLEKTFVERGTKLKTEMKEPKESLNNSRTYSLPAVVQNDFKSLLQDAIKENREKEEESQFAQGRQGAHSEKSWFSYSSLDPDSPQLTENDHEKINETALGRIMKWGIFRYCRHCKSFKPLRTHHCQQCMRCVLKMDHHCQWVLNCIGLRNYKYFMNMLIYANLTLIFILIIFSRCVMDVALNPYIDGLTIYTVLINFMLSFVMLCLVFIFTCFHFWLILAGKTTLEYCEKDRKGIEKEEKDKGPKEASAFKTISYNEGPLKNFLSVFNKNPLFWFFPVNPNSEEDGLFERFEENCITQFEEK